MLRPTALLLLLALGAPVALLARTWTSTDGKTIDAEQTDFLAPSNLVVLTTPTGHTYKIPLARLSPADQALAKAYQPLPYIKIDVAMDPPHTHSASPVYWDGADKQYMATERDGNVTVTNMSTFTTNITVVTIFFEPKSEARPGAHRSILKHLSNPLTLDAGASDTIPVNASGIASVFVDSDTGRRVASGQWVDTFAVLIQSSTGAFIDVKSTRPEVESYVKDNYPTIVADLTHATQLATTGSTP